MAAVAPQPLPVPSSLEEALDQVVPGSSLSDKEIAKNIIANHGSQILTWFANDLLYMVEGQVSRYKRNLRHSLMIKDSGAEDLVRSRVITKRLGKTSQPRVAAMAGFDMRWYAPCPFERKGVIGDLTPAEAGSIADQYAHRSDEMARKEDEFRTLETLGRQYQVKNLFELAKKGVAYPEV